MDRIRVRDLAGSINKCYSLQSKKLADQNKSPEKKEPAKTRVRSPRKRSIREVHRSEGYDGDAASNGSEVIGDKSGGLLNDAIKPDVDGDEIEEPERKRRSFEDGECKENEVGSVSMKFEEDTIKELMFQAYQPWVIRTYGDSAKTKTISEKKHQRILQTLSGQDSNSHPDSSKFRFWVKAKGFAKEKPDNFKEVPAFYTDKPGTPEQESDHLYVPNITKEVGIQPFRRVAVVERFFDIIYNVHVGLGGRSGRHAGQKRTYRTITETYAFLPRDAVTKFLSGCRVCNKNGNRPFTPSRLEDTCTESSSELDALHTILSAKRARSTGCSTPSTDKSEPIHPLCIDNSHVTQKPEVLPSDNQSDPSLNANNLPATLSYLDQCTARLTEYQQFQLNNNAGLNDLEVSNELMNYYQLLRLMYEQTLKTAAQPEKMFTSTPEPKPKIQRSNDTSPPVIDLTITQSHSDANTNSSSSSNININFDNAADRPVRTISPPAASSSMTISPRSGRGNNITINSTGMSINVQNSSRELTISCKTTPPKKRFANYRASDDGDAKGKSNLSGAFALDNNFNNNTTSDSALVIDSSEDSPEKAANHESKMKLEPAANANNTAAESSSEPVSNEDTYAGLMKDADKLKLMLLAWNYQNSNAVRNGTEGPDLGMMGGLWAQYQNALAMNTPIKLESSPSPPSRIDQSSPNLENPDESSSSGHKDDDDGSEDDSDDRLDQNTSQDPERLKAFNMFVRLFVDENLDRMIPISKQPKEKIQAIIDSCTRQFPEFSERARKRIRTYLKSCRRNKKTREGWETTSRPTPAHLTSVQAEQLLAMACENESMNAKRMRIGLDPISQSIPPPVVNTTEATASSISYPLGFKNTLDNEATSSTTITSLPKTSTMTSMSEIKPLLSSSLGNANTGGLNNTSLYRSDIKSLGYNTNAQQYQQFFNNAPATTNAPTDLSMKQLHSPTQSNSSQLSLLNQQQQQLLLNPMKQQSISPPPVGGLLAAGSAPNAAPARLPLLPHKLTPPEIVAVRQLITGYRESAAFLLRSADELENVLQNQHTQN